MKKIQYIIGLLFLGFGLSAQQQNTFSLQQAIDYALQNNFDIRNAKTDIQIAKKKVVETRAIGLPHINASVGYDYFVDVPTQLMPDFISPAMIEVNQKVFGLTPVVPVSGEPRMLEMQFGQAHNLSAGITATQLLFNGSYLVGLQASKTYVRLSQAMLEKKEKEVKHSVARAYYPVIIVQENLSLLDSTLISLQEMLIETKAFYKEGFLEDTDVDQMSIMINDIQNTKKKLENTKEIAAKNLKFQMGMSIETPIHLTEDLTTLLETVAALSLDAKEFNVAKHQDYRLLQANKALKILDVKNKRAALLPNLSAYFNYQEKAMRDEFDFFDTDQDWFPTQVVGAKLNIPIFQSWQSRAQIQQKKLELEKVKVQEIQLKEALALKYESTKSNLSYSIDVFYNKELKMKQAKRIYQKTKSKFKEGMASSLDLTQTFNQYLQAQMEHLSAMMELLNNKENMEQEIGE